MKQRKLIKLLQKKDMKYERCVLCDSLTDVRCDLPVECRQNYIYSAGQLCEKCYHSTYGEALKKRPQKKGLEYEECVLCGSLTDIRFDLPIDCRQYYIYGVGQLCEKCYHKTYCETNE